MKRYFRLTVFWILIIHLPASATIINIPDDYETIQEGIDASTDGDTVLVQPGTYVENINFNGHNIVLGSLFLTTGDTTYIAETIIDGDSSGCVVVLQSGEDSTTVLTGLTITGGSGGGIHCYYSNLTIINNIITRNNKSGGGGAGISCHFSSNIKIFNNTITFNHVYNYESAVGGGIRCMESDVTIYGNIISDNSTDGFIYGGAGGGIYIVTSDVMIANNIINRNYATGGGGIFICFPSDINIVNNVVTGNSSDGLWCYNVDPAITNTIFWMNNGPEIDLNGSSNPLIQYCNIEGGWEGEGNIDADPFFRDPDNDDFHLMSTACGDALNSPCIDAGSPVIIDSLLDCSWGLGTILSDMGAYGGGDSATVGVIDQEPRVPERFALQQNYANPFNTKTIIRYNLPSDSDVTIEIFDILGRRLEIIVNEEQPAGYHQAVWNANRRSSGVYFYRIQAGKHSETRKMLLIR